MFGGSGTLPLTGSEPEARTLPASPIAEPAELFAINLMGAERAEELRRVVPHRRLGENRIGSHEALAIPAGRISRADDAGLIDIDELSSGGIAGVLGDCSVGEDDPAVLRDLLQPSEEDLPEVVVSAPG
jgi:hypothetical protein